MSLKDIIETPKDHILEARSIAEKIYQKNPAKQIEMLAEIKDQLRKRLVATSEEIKSL